MSRLRIRSIKPEFFADEKVNAISRDARYLTIGLITRADDRGRQQAMEQAILGHVYPAGDVTLKQLHAWLGEVIDVGIARAYDAGPFSYLWLPHFWRHQKINRPSESSLPAHPDDPYGRLKIGDALAAWRTENLSEQFSESLTESSSPRAQARVPLHSDPPTESSQGEETVDARTRTRRADPDSLPADYPDELAGVAASVLAVVLRVQDERGGEVPTLRGVALAVRRYADRDHVHVAGELEHWATAGNGRSRPVKDWAKQYAAFLDRSPASSPSRPAKPARGDRSWRASGEAAIREATGSTA